MLGNDVTARRFQSVYLFIMSTLHYILLIIQHVTRSMTVVSIKVQDSIYNFCHDSLTLCMYMALHVSVNLYLDTPAVPNAHARGSTHDYIVRLCKFLMLSINLM